MTFRTKMKYIEQTYEICIDYCRSQSDENKARLIKVLRCWLYHPYKLKEYDYSQYWDDPVGAISYCSDRMNNGRAKAILTLLGEPNGPN
jgi:hypothetical protein